ncbi:MAG TPA: Fe-S cluster assembly protein SufD [Mariprofundaceae bacterium]|nr:Fe-S cluster assembly protein SufD [Mariprofundaceae bacterium]
MSDIVRKVREQGQAAFARLGLPTTRLETWKYTDVKRAMAPFLERLAEAPAKPETLDTATIKALSIADLDAYRLILVDGRMVAEASDLPEGVHAESLAKLLAEHPEQGIEPLGMEEDAPLFNGFVALNAAHAQDGVGICIDDKIKLDKPLYILHICSGQVAHVCHGIHVGTQAEATVIEHYAGLDEATGFTNVVTQVRLMQAGHLRHIRLQQESGKQTHIGRVSVHQRRDSQYSSHSIALGAALSRVDIVTSLAEAGAACNLNGLYLTTGRQHADHHTVIDHKAPHCTSREMYRGVMDGRSRAVFNGRVVVGEGAIKTDSAQTNANLLLSATAEVDTKPELEIYNDDVKCAHGATIGQLDPNQLFYLKSRGLSEDEARQLLTFAFADEVLVSIDVPAVRRHIERAAFSKLPLGADISEVLA